MHVHMSVHVCTHACAQVCTHVSTHIRAYVRTHACIHGYTRVCTHVHTCIYVHVHRHVHTHVCTHIYAHVYTHVYSHVYTSLEAPAVAFVFWYHLNPQPFRHALLEPDWALLTARRDAVLFGPSGDTPFSGRIHRANRRRRTLPMHRSKGSASMCLIDTDLGSHTLAFPS